LDKIPLIPVLFLAFFILGITNSPRKSIDPEKLQGETGEIVPEVSQGEKDETDEPRPEGPQGEKDETGEPGPEESQEKNDDPCEKEELDHHWQSGA